MSYFYHGKGMASVQIPRTISAEAYQDWLDQSRSPDPRGGATKTNGQKLRQAVEMRRRGSSCDEIKRLLGQSTLNWFRKLPAELGA